MPGPTYQVFYLRSIDSADVSMLEPMTHGSGGINKAEAL